MKTKLAVIMLCPIVKVRFYDHFLGSTELLECEAYGRLIHQDAKQLTLITWLPLLDREEDMGYNWEVLTLLKSSVIKTTRLK